MENERWDMLIHMLLKSQQQQISLQSDWNGDLGWWYIDTLTETIYVNPLFLQTLGYTPTSITNGLTMSELNDMIVEEDQPLFREQLELHLQGEASVLEITFRVRNEDGRIHQFYLNGKLDPESVESDLPYITGTVYDVSRQYMTKKELKKQPEPLHQQQMHDLLTSVLTKEHFQDHLYHAITLARAGQQNFCLCVIDLDFFKNINEHFGRERGDQVLTEVGEILRRETRNTDHIGRTSGDKFQIILSDVEFKTGQIIAERIRKTIANHMFVSGIRITISGSLVYFDHQSFEDLLNTAFNLLKKSKDNGHNKMTY